MQKCENVQKQGDYMKCKKFVCKSLNDNLHSNIPLQNNDQVAAHLLQLTKGFGISIIVKFLRKHKAMKEKL